jgi:hypothetical protein
MYFRYTSIFFAAIVHVQAAFSSPFSMHVHGHALRTWTCSMNMDMQQGMDMQHRHEQYGNVAWTWTLGMGMDTRHVHEHTAWTWTCSMRMIMDLDINLDKTGPGGLVISSRRNVGDSANFILRCRRQHSVLFCAVCDTAKWDLALSMTSQNNC